MLEKWAIGVIGEIQKKEEKPMTTQKERPIEVPSAEAAARALVKATGMDDFYGKDGLVISPFQSPLEGGTYN